MTTFKKITGLLGAMAAAVCLLPASGQQWNSAHADTVQLTPNVIVTGKWTEEFAFDGSSLWVAESGQRTISQVDLRSGTISKRVKVGRLPVEILAAPDGNVYSLVHTDSTVWRQKPNGKGSVLANVGECPEDMVANGSSIFVLTLPACSSESSRVIRVDTRRGKQAKSPVFGEWAMDITAIGSEVWVAHARFSTITVVDSGSLNGIPYNFGDAEFWTIDNDGQNVYAGGRTSGTTDDGIVLKIDPNTKQEIAKAFVTERISEITSDGSIVVAVGSKGTIWLFSANDLSLLRTITMTSGPFEPRGVGFVNDALVVSVSTYQGENGAIFALGNWRPDVNATQPPVQVHNNAPDNGAAPPVYGVTPEGIRGTYSRVPVENSAHIGNIEPDGPMMRWTNFAGVSWMLVPDLNLGQLLTGQDNPYYQGGQKEFKLIVENGQVTGFRFGDETYMKGPTMLPAQ